MKVFEANITFQVSNYLNKTLNKIISVNGANQLLFDTFRIASFFENDNELIKLKDLISETQSVVSESERAEYGDFQTNIVLTNRIAAILAKKDILPKIIIEPTCGKGNFILASINNFTGVEKIIGVEIYKPYIWECKFSILDFYLQNPLLNRPEIMLTHGNVFDFDFKKIAEEYGNKEILIIGNPPWVTNSTLGSLNSSNLPNKSNFKNHNGLDAMTGKGNFDIGEYITLMMLDAFQNSKGHLAFLVKNSVIKNVVFDQFKRKYNVSDIQKFNIDSKKEFNVSVEASLLYCELNSTPEYNCKEFDFYHPEGLESEFGWIGEKFVSNTELYRHSKEIDGVCPFEWRQGIKHDLSSIMELERLNGHFVNGKHEEITLEEDLVFGILKSSDLKQKVINQPRKFTIITQKKVGQDTSFIKQNFPKTFEYLLSNKQFFDQRKSSIYNNKPDYSIFGIGEYSFTPYKVAISGLYKTFSFSLVLPLNEKPIMLDDTCYLLGFDNLEFAAYTTILLNSIKTKELLQAISFSDAKRTFTKDILMRIDLYKLALPFSESAIKEEINSLNANFNLDISPNKWDDYMLTMKPKNITKQIGIFAFADK